MLLILYISCSAWDILSFVCLPNSLVILENKGQQVSSSKKEVKPWMNVTIHGSMRAGMVGMFLWACLCLVSWIKKPYGVYVCAFKLMVRKNREEEHVENEGSKIYKRKQKGKGYCWGVSVFLCFQVHFPRAAVLTAVLMPRAHHAEKSLQKCQQRHVPCFLIQEQNSNVV